MAEGRCLCGQRLNLCKIQKRQAVVYHPGYETGRPDDLPTITEMNRGITVVPYLAATLFYKAQKEKPRHFVTKGPLRVLEKEIVAAASPYPKKGNRSDCGFVIARP